MANPRGSQFFIDVGKFSGQCSLHIQTAFHTGTLFLSKFRLEDTWEKVKFDTFNPETDAICGC